MSTLLRWGILGTGNIAKQFANGMKTARRGQIAAVGSRSPESAATFAQTFSVAAQHDYEGLLRDPNVDAIYLSLPNSMHREWTIKALHAGKPVLCEKPFAMNGAQSQEMFDVAEKTGLPVVEAFMYRSHPYVRAVDEVIRSGAVGTIKHIRTNFCYRTNKFVGNIRFERELGGGVLMDVGCYCINFSRHFAGGEPVAIQATTKFHERGVDELTSAILQFDNNVIATFSCGNSLQADNTATICGTDAFIEIPVPWKPVHGKAGYTLAYSTPPRQDQKDASTPPTPPRQTVAVDVDKDLFAMEADDFAATVLDGAPPVITRADTLGNMRVLDEIRRQIGLNFL